MTVASVPIIEPAMNFGKSLSYISFSKDGCVARPYVFVSLESVL